MIRSSKSGNNLLLHLQFVGRLITVRGRDRRSLGGTQKPSGVLVGHTEGITNVSAKGDGRYVISNGKDQALRLWDLRKMCSSEDFDSFARKGYKCQSYDYR